MDSYDHPPIVGRRPSQVAYTGDPVRDLMLGSLLTLAAVAFALAAIGLLAADLNPYVWGFFPAVAVVLVYRAVQAFRRFHGRRRHRGSGGPRPRRERPIF